MDTYCKIFMDCDAEYDEIFGLISNYLAGTPKGVSTIITSWCSISLKRNSYYNKNLYLKNSDDFVYWKYYLDMECLEGVSFDEYIKNISRMMSFLRTFCLSIVPSCDFEDMLM